MTVSVHHENDNYVDRDDYVEVGRTEYPAQHGREAFARIEYENVERTCLKPMRGWSSERTTIEERTGRRYVSKHTHHGFCLLDKGHRGRHSTVVFNCDACGRTLRGEPASVHNEEGVQFCYLCSRGHWR